MLWLLSILFLVVGGDNKCDQTYDWCISLKSNGGLFSFIIEFYNNIIEKNICLDLYELCKFINNTIFK